MAEVEVTLITHELFGTARGDAFARTHETLNFEWNNFDQNDFVGTDLKNTNPENVLFLRYRIDNALPPGSTLLKAKFVGFVPAGGAILDGPEGKFRVGALQQDGIWNHVNSRGFVPGPEDWEYEESPAAPTLPFPTFPGTDAINTGALVGNRFLGTVAYTFDDESVIFEMGDEDYSPTHILDDFNPNPVARQVTIARVFGWAHVAFVVDPFEVPAADPESINFLTDDSVFLGEPKGTWGFHLVITYEENPPTITSAPGPANGAPGVLYDYGPLTANDPLPGDSATVTFALVDPEDGMTVIFDGGAWRFDWTPSLTAPAVYTVKLQATDEDGFTSAIQTWTVAIQPDGVPGEVCSELEITKAVSGSIEVTEGVGGSMEVGVAVSGKLDVSPSVDGTLKVTPTVEGTLEVEKCP